MGRKVGLVPEVPSIPIGTGTVAGLVAAITAFVMAVIAFINGDRSEETIGALVVGGVVLYGVITSRGKQASAAVAAAGHVEAAKQIEAGLAAKVGDGSWEKPALEGGATAASVAQSQVG